VYLGIIYLQKTVVGGGDGPFVFTANWTVVHANVSIVINFYYAQLPRVFLVVMT